MNTQMKGTFSRWSENSARWYEEASKYTRYHEKLTEYIVPHLDPQGTCCELACGTGTLARHLAPFTLSYTANDIDPHSIQFCRDMQEKNPLPNLELILGDWHDTFRDKTFGTVVFSYFGAVIKDWEALKQIAEKKVIAVVPRYDEEELRQKAKAFSGQSRFRNLTAQESERDSAFDSSSPSRSLSEEKGKPTDKREKADGGEKKKKKRPFETMEAISAFLEEKKVPHKTIPLTLEFGQPARTIQEAEEYAGYYYRFETEEELHEFVKMKFQPADCGYFFSKKKNIGIVIADMTSQHSC